MGFARVFGAGSAIALATLACLACSSFGGDDPAKALPTSDAGSEGGNPSGDGATCATIFVSPTGDDSRRGCDQAAPVKTVAGAIGRAKEAGAREVRICTGSYDEQALTLDAAISLRGGYDCATWERTKTETHLTRLGQSIDAATLVINGEAVTHEAEIDGLFIDGPEKGATGTAVRITNGAKPYLHDLTVVGGATSGTPNGDALLPGAIGVDIATGSAPEIAASRISGGFGIGALGPPAQLASDAIRVKDASPKLHDLQLDDGITHAVKVAVAISGASRLDGDSAISRLTIKVTNSDTAARGITIQGADAHVDIVDSTIDLGSMPCSTAGANCSSIAIGITSGTVNIVRNRIIGGEILDGQGSSSILGINFTTGATGDIANNLISLGNEKNTAAVTAVGIIVHAASPRILFNTIASASAFDTVAIAADQGSTISVDGNFISSRKGTALSAESCPASFSSLTGNLFVGHTSVLRCTSPAADLTTLKSIAEAVAPHAANNHRLGSDCTGDTACDPVSCSPGGDCTVGLVTGGGSTGATLRSDGWKPLPSAKCALVTPAFTPSAAEASVQRDVESTPRTAPYSRGAYEVDVASCTP